MKGLLATGKISKPFGSDGGVYVNLYDTSPGSINTGEPLYVVIDMLTVPLFLSSLERRGTHGAVLVFDDIDTPERAEELMGLELFVRSDANIITADAADDQIYFEDLIGYNASIRGHKEKGVIIDFADHDLNPLLFVEIGGREVIIPAVDEFIAKIDTKKRTVTFRLPDGLLEL